MVFIYCCIYTPILECFVILKGSIMTINFLDLYNDVASQPWSMFDSGAAVKEDFEPALVSSINKAIIDIWYSYPFPFRVKKYSLSTMRNIQKYKLPNGNIINEDSIEDNLFAIKIDDSYLEYNPDITESNVLIGKPQEFSIVDDELIIYPIPDKRYVVSIKYLTLAIGFDKDENEIFYLENPTDFINIPEKYEPLLKNAILAKALVDSIASVNDENYAGYKLQFDKAYKLLIKITNPVKKSKFISF